MKCKVCGAYNKPEYKKCIRCGNPLLSPDEEQKQKKLILEHQSPLKNTPTFREAVIIEEQEKPKVEKDIKPGTHKETMRENDLWSGQPKKKPFLGRKKKNTTLLALKDESEASADEREKPESLHPRSRRRAAKDSNLDKLSKIREGEEVEVILPPEQKKKKEKRKKKKRLNLKWGRIALVSATAGIVIVGLVIGFFYLFRGIFSGMSGIFSGHEEMPNGGKPMVERVFINGQTWHRITFYGEDGERVLVDEPVRSLSIQDNKAVLLLDDLSFVPEESITDETDQQQEYVEVALSASLFSTKGDETLLDVPSYKIPVPPSPLKIVYPTEPDLKVEYTQVLVKIKVDPGSRVLIAGTNLTDIVDSDGFVQKYVNLTEGVNEIPIEVETYKHRSTYETVKVSRPELDVMIELNEPDSSFHEDEIWIKGYTEPNTDIGVDRTRVTADVSYGEVEERKLDDGTMQLRRPFEFRYLLSDYGWNDIKMVATTSDGRTATLIHRVERVPDHRSYTRVAWPLDTNYDYLSDATSSLIGRVFDCRGEVIRREDTDTSRMYLFNAGTDAETKYVMIEYTGNQEISVNKKYVIYADVIGSYETYPLLAGRFIYDYDEIVGTSEPTASPTASPTATPEESPTEET